MLRRVFDPLGPQDSPFRRRFFEGWYFKLVDATEAHCYAVIPGVFIGREPASSHAFVQTLDGAMPSSAAMPSVPMPQPMRAQTASSRADSAGTRRCSRAAPQPRRSAW